MKNYHLEPNYMKLTKEFIDFYHKQKFRDKISNIILENSKDYAVKLFDQNKIKLLNDFRTQHNMPPVSDVKEIITIMKEAVISVTNIPEQKELGARLTAFTKSANSIIESIKEEMEDVAYMNDSLSEIIQDFVSENKHSVYITVIECDSERLKSVMMKKLSGLEEKPKFFAKKPPIIKTDNLINDIVHDVKNLLEKSGINKYCKISDHSMNRLELVYVHIPVSQDVYNYFEKEDKSADRRSMESISDYIIRNALNTHETLTSAKKEKSYKCPVCKKAKYTTPKLLENHVLLEHENEVPPQMPVAQFIFNLKNKKTHGSCVICKKETPWNPEINKYFRFCSEECKSKYVTEAKQRLMKVYGTDNLAKDPEHQKKMLENRKISKKYVYEDGTSIVCVGSYEYDFIKFNDEVLGIGSGSIEPCSLVFKYDFEGKERSYIPDYYIPSLNLIIEIKDKGDNNHPNIKIHMKNMDIEKFKAIVESNKYNFIVVAGKDYESYIEMIDYLKSRDVNEKDNNKLLIQIPKDVYKNFQKSNEMFFGAGNLHSIHMQQVHQQQMLIEQQQQM